MDDVSKSPSPGLVRFAGFYCVVLMTLYNIAAVGLIAVPVAFILKNRLHLDATSNATFSFFTDSPYFFGFAFGFLRDRWRPGGQGDRGYFAVVPILLALTYVALAYGPQTYGGLMTGMIAISACSALLGAAAQGLLAGIGKEFGMTGRLAAVTLVTTRGSQIYSTTVGGWLGDHTAFQIPFLASAAVCLTVLVLAFWHPKTIFRSGDELLVKVVPEGSMEAIRRLIRHKAIYLPAVVLFLWEFAPGWGTPLFYYLTNQVHLSESAYGATKGWQQLGTVTAALSYGWLCKHIRFRTLLYIGTFVGVLGGPIFLLIHSPAQANIISLLAGGSCGLALASYFDLLVRSCPDELEGVAFMLTYATFTFASDGSDIFGGWLYDRGGFGLALAISTAFTALIFLPVSLVPKKISDPEEGEPITDSDPPVAEFVTS